MPPFCTSGERNDLRVARGNPAGNETRGGVPRVNQVQRGERWVGAGCGESKGRDIRPGDATRSFPQEQALAALRDKRASLGNGAEKGKCSLRSPGPPKTVPKERFCSDLSITQQKNNSFGHLVAPLGEENEPPRS